MEENDMTSKRKIVVLGGSYAGISTAHYLLKHVIRKLHQPNDYQIVLVNASEETICRPACPRAMISDEMFDQARLFVRIPEQFAQYEQSSFRFIHGIVIDTELQGRKLAIERQDGQTEQLDYHALIVTTGASASSPLHGPNKDIPQLKQAWSQFREGLTKASSIVIAGGGPTGVETAGELGEYLNGSPSWFSSTPRIPKVAITLITSSEQLLPHLRPSLSNRAESLLSSVGVTVLKFTRVTITSPPNAGRTIDTITTAANLTLHDATTNTTSTLSTDIFIPCTGTKPNTSFLPTTLLTTDGRITTDSATLRVDAQLAGPRVYALGDASNAARPAVHNVLEQVPAVGASIREDLLRDGSTEGEGATTGSASSHGNRKLFMEDHREMQLVPIGKRTGVGAAMGWYVPGWLVWAIKGRDYWLWTTGGLWSGKMWDGKG